MTSTDPALLARAVARHATALPSLAAASEDDLAVLDPVFDGARVVALGEATHFVTEIGAVQRRLVRHLAERHGFTVLAYELGFAEGLLLDRWVHGEGTDDALDLHPDVPDADSAATRRRFRWLRDHHRRGGTPLRVVGVDTPCGGGSLRPALEPLLAFLARADPESLGVAREALAIASRWEALSHAGAAPRWAALPEADRSRLTATLARLALRLDALAPLLVARSGQAAFDLARRHLEVARVADDMVGAVHGLFAGTGPSYAASTRDHLMAGNLQWHLDRLDDDARVVLVAHDLHVQRVPVVDDVAPTLVMGAYLAVALGDAYRTVAITHTAARAPAIVMTDADPHGFVVDDADVAPHPPDGVEGALLAAGLGGVDCVLPLAPLRGDPRTAPLSLAAQGAPVPIDMTAAFDAVLAVPTATTTPDVSLY